MNSSDPLTREELENIRIALNSAALTMNRPMSEPMKPDCCPHVRVTEYDGAFWCLDCNSKWGALPGEPSMPADCVKPAQETPRTDAADDVTMRFSERFHRLRQLAFTLEREAERALAEAKDELAITDDLYRKEVLAHGETDDRAEQAEALVEQLQGALRERTERCAKVCEEYAAMRWDVYRRSDGQDRANPYVEGQSDAADHCAAAIRALDEPKS